MSELQTIPSIDAVDAFIEPSNATPVFVLKHSLTCPISASAFHRFQTFVDEHDGDDVSFGLIEIQNAREVSNHVADKTGVRHESPQALLFRGGAVIWHASHGAIKGDALKAALADWHAGT